MSWYIHMIYGATRKNCAPSEDSVQSGHWPSLIRVFGMILRAAHMPLCLFSCCVEAHLSDLRRVGTLSREGSEKVSVLSVP